MKTLLLLRHAKSSWKDPDLADFDRPLKKRGKKAAPRVGAFMRERKLSPDLVLSSPAKRAVQTAELVLDRADVSVEPRYDRRLYAASASELLHVLQEVEDDVGQVLLVGHNPGLEELLELLTGNGEPMPTAALAAIALEIESWHEVGKGTGRLDWIVRPQEIEEGSTD